jgi:hypothetical protein
MSAVSAMKCTPQKMTYFTGRSLSDLGGDLRELERVAGEVGVRMISSVW